MDLDWILFLNKNSPFSVETTGGLTKVSSSAQEHGVREKHTFIIKGRVRPKELSNFKAEE